MEKPKDSALNLVAEYMNTQTFSLEYKFNK